MKRSIYGVIMLVIIGILSACSRNAENEHLPEYCQTYAGFVSVASADMFELLDDGGYDLNRFNYLSVISEIELEFEVDEVGRDIDLGGLQCFQNLTSLTLVGRSFKDISEISALSNIQSIELRNTSVVSIDSFKNLSKINNLVISDTLTLQNVDGVGEMTKLTSLDLSDNGLVNVGELNSLVNLQHLYLDNNDIVYFPSINNLAYLETLDISDNKIIQLGEDLSGLSNLISLDASHNQICDISTLDDLSSLRTLDLSYNNLGCVGNGVSPDFDSLENAPYLTTLKLNDNNLTSIEGLRDRDINLEVLHLQNNNLTDITPIGEYTDIIDLVLYNNNISNIDDLSGMTGLSVIDLSDNQLTDFDDLLSIPNLTEVDLSLNNITTIPDITVAWPNLRVLDLHSNRISNMSGIQGHQTLEELILYNNGLTALVDISNLPNLEELLIKTPTNVDPDEVPVQRTNQISRIENCFNDTPSLTIHDNHILFLDFILSDNLQIFGSFSNYNAITEIAWANRSISYIDSESFKLANLKIIDLQGTNITDIEFILDNPDLETLDISGTLVSNLSVISGVNTDDLDNLEVVIADNIDAGNDIVDAFIELPSLEEISLLGTNVNTISNAFNGLESLATISIDGENLTSIEDAFNNIFGTYASSNAFSFDGTRIAVIDNSFNGGVYHSFELVDTNTFGASYIQDSFNNLDFSSGESMTFTSTNFTSIDNSFNNVTVSELLFNLGRLDSITNSFAASEFELLDVSANDLQTLPSINTVTSLTELVLDDNQLHTVAFIDNINGLTSLSIVNQNNGFAHTLGTLDGINNLPLLEEFSFLGNGFSEIDGLKNVGLTELDFSNTMAIIDTISATSFTSTSLTALNLTNHMINDVSFLANLPLLEELLIGLNVVDFTGFTGLAIEETLQSLTLTNVSTTYDFAPFADYDNLTVFDIPGTVVILANYTGLDGIDDIGFNVSTVNTITNSFNDFPAMSPAAFSLIGFTNLQTITNSFDFLDSSVTNIDILSDMTIIDSFNNIEQVTITGGAEQTTPLFDADSFDSIVGITFENAGYDDYAFLTNYVTLTEIIIERLEQNLIGFDNENILLFDIESASLDVDELDVMIALNPNAELRLTTSRNDVLGAISLTTNAAVLTLDANFGDVDVTFVDVTLAEIDGTSKILSVVSNNITTLYLDIDSEDITVSGDALIGVEQLGSIVDEITITSTLQNLTVNMDVADMYINSTNLDNLTITNTGNYVQVNTGVGVDFLTVDISALDVYFASSGNLQQIDGTLSNVVTVGIDASTLVTYNIPDSGDLLVFNTNAATLDITTSSTTEITINNNSMTSLTFDVGGSDITVNSTLFSTLDADGTANSLILYMADLNVLTVSDTTVLDTLFVESSVPDIDLGASVISSVALFLTNTILEIVGTGSPDVVLDNNSMTDLTFNIPNSTLTITDTPIIMTATLHTTTVDFVLDNFNGLQSFTLDPSSTVTSITVGSSSTLQTVNTNDVIFSTLVLDTDNASLTVDAANVGQTTLSGNALTNLTVSGGMVVVDTPNNAMNMNISASEVLITGDVTTITFNDASAITTLTMDIPNSQQVNGGNAILGNVTIDDTAAFFQISGPSINTIYFNADATTLNITVDLLSTVIIDSSASSAVAINVNTETLDVTANRDVSITSSALTSVLFNVGINDITLTLNHGTETVRTIEGNASIATILGTNIYTLNITAGTSLDTLVTEDLNLTVLDTTDSTIDAIDMFTSQGTLNITSPTATAIAVEGDNVTSLTINSSIADVEFVSDTLGLDVYGEMKSLSIDGPSIEVYGHNDSIMEDFTFSNDQIDDLGLPSSISNSVTIFTSQSDFTLRSQSPTVTVTGSNPNHLRASTTSYTMSGGIAEQTIHSNFETITLSGTDTIFMLDTPNATSILGQILGFSISGSTVASISVIVTADSIVFADTGSLTSILIDGPYSITDGGVVSPADPFYIDTLDITASSNLTTIDTDDGVFVDVTLNYQASSATTVNMNMETTNLTFEDTGNLTAIYYNGIQANVFDVTITGPLSILNTYTATIGTLIVDQQQTTATQVTTTADAIEISAAILGGLTEVNVIYEGVIPLDVHFTDLNNSTVTMVTDNEVVLAGNVGSLELVGAQIDTVTTTSLSVSDTYTMNDTTLTNLDFASATLLASLGNLEMNTLNVTDITYIISVLDGTSVVLYSDLTDQDIYDYYYDDELASITAQEAIDNVIYDGLRSDAIDASWLDISTNIYMNYVDETTMRNLIDSSNGDIGTEEQYFQDYLTEAGILVGDLETGEEATIRATITATLTHVLALMDEPTLQAAKTAAIEAQADTNALASQDALTFSIGA